MNNALLLTPQTDPSAGYFITTHTSTDGQIVLPLKSGETYDFDYRVDGGSWVNVTSDSHTITGLPTTGTRTLEIDHKDGGLPAWFYNNGGDKLKIQSVEQWGGKWFNESGLINGFFGCSNLVINATDTLYGAEQMGSVFRNCPLINPDMSNWDFSNVISCGGLFKGCTSLTNELPDMPLCVGFVSVVEGCVNWNGSVNFISGSPTTLEYAFFGVTSFNKSLASIDVSQLTAATQMLGNVTISTANYDATLISWAAQTVQPNVNANFGNSQYTLGGAAEAARNTLTSAPNNWTITDGGGV